MDTNWATEHLQTIRTLMERSALYRRALAPISTFVGVVGIVAAIGGWLLHIPGAGPFSLFWMAVGLFAVIGALLIVRKQAVKQKEQFWSPPTRRVAQAMAPALSVGAVIGLIMMINDWNEREASGAIILVTSWTLLYGLALHAAGFFITRGIRLLGWGFLIAGFGWWVFLRWGPDNFLEKPPHLLMGVLFGASHLAYGIYLYFTERKNET